MLRPSQTVPLHAHTPAALAQALYTALPSFSSAPDPFLIVEDEAGRFVQVWANGPDAFHVEYGDGVEVYELPGGDRPLDKAVEIFGRFAEGVWPPFEGGTPVPL